MEIRIKPNKKRIINVEKLETTFIRNYFENLYK